MDYSLANSTNLSKAQMKAEIPQMLKELERLHEEIVASRAQGAVYREQSKATMTEIRSMLAQRTGTDS